MNDNAITDTQNKTDKFADLLMKRVFMRIAHVLTEEDMNTIEELDKEDESGEAVKSFLINKVPNFDTIVEEETRHLSKYSS